MVVEVFEHVVNNGIDYNPVFTVGYGDKKKRMEYEESWAECECMYDEGKLFFADISVQRWSDIESSRYSHHMILEIKPKIYSAGALLRQIKVQKRNIDALLKTRAENSDFRIGRSLESWATVAAVVTHGDPSLDLFMRMVDDSQVVFTWNGSSLMRHTKSYNIDRAAA